MTVPINISVLSMKCNNILGSTMISVASFGKAAFRHLNCNGLVSDPDGKKMIKGLQNHPTPIGVIGDYAVVCN